MVVVRQTNPVRSTVLPSKGMKLLVLRGVVGEVVSNDWQTVAISRLQPEISKLVFLNGRTSFDSSSWDTVDIYHVDTHLGLNKVYITFKLKMIQT